MTNLIPTLNRQTSSTHIVTRRLISWLLFFRSFLASIPLSAANSLGALSGEIGKAAGMAYVDPFMSNIKDRK